MCLDQYVYTKTAESREKGESSKFVWRRHSKLQTFMENFYVERTGLPITDLDCGELTLQAGDIDALEQAAKGSAYPALSGRRN